MRECAPPSGTPVQWPLRWRLAAALLVLITLVAALYVARAVMLPLALSIVLAALLAPVADVLQRLYLPRSLAAALVVSALISVAVVSITLLGEPALTWLDRIPELLVQLQERISALLEPLRRAGDVARAVEEATGAPTVQLASLRAAILSGTWQVVAGAAVVTFLLFFVLSSGNTFLRKLVEVLPTWRDKRLVVTAARRIRHDVSRYLFTVAVINTFLGIVVGMTMYGLGMPNPMLWGVMAGLLNFVPYLGPALTLTVIAGVALITVEELSSALLRPLAFFVLTTLEGQIITPMILGRRLLLNPLVVFLGLVFWGWLWGIVGALIAVPLTMMIKIICDAVPPLTPVGKLMGR